MTIPPKSGATEREGFNKKARRQFAADSLKVQPQHALDQMLGGALDLCCSVVALGQSWSLGLWVAQTSRANRISQHLSPLIPKTPRPPQNPARPPADPTLSPSTHRQADVIADTLQTVGIAPGVVKPPPATVLPATAGTDNSPILS